MDELKVLAFKSSNSCLKPASKLLDEVLYEGLDSNCVRRRHLKDLAVIFNFPK